MKEIERDFVGERCCHWDLGSERERERRANGVGYIAFLFMAVCPNPLPGLLPADGLLSFIISCSFSFFSSSSGFFYLSLSSLPSLCRLVAHFELAAAAAWKRFSRLEPLRQLRIPFTSLSLSVNILSLALSYSPTSFPFSSWKRLALGCTLLPPDFDRLRVHC